MFVTGDQVRDRTTRHLDQPEQILERTIEQGLTAATAAPSLVNSQPWRVRAARNTVLICANRARRLPAHDPCDRELLIACGEFTVCAEVALLVAGLTCRTEHLPEPTFAPVVIATLLVGPAEIGAGVDQRTRQLANVMAHSEYDRRPFTSTPVTAKQISQLRHAVESEGAWLQVLDGDRRVEAAVLHMHGHDMLGADQHAADELQRWIRHQDVYDDGVPAHAVDLIVASGNVVHNFGGIGWKRPDDGFDWTRRFDEYAKEMRLGDPTGRARLDAHPDYRSAVPTPDPIIPAHYLARLAGAAGESGAQVRVDGNAYGSLSMTAYTLGMACPNTHGGGGGNPQEVSTAPAGSSNM